MAKKSTGNGLSKLVSFVAWLTGVIVALAVGFALIDGGLSVPYLGMVNAIAGYVVVIATILGVILGIVDSLK
ncbi:hypothetical protein CMI46_01505 [Candidatus Pacearchaeota archaeon]|nr:hypothetical protein [Candidatus Pacearchaeota archaeon]|tara:strand:+ start:14183 stop:14398 length:216 start_codon:yes stop_codon:yes gene_type:complete